MMIRFTRVMGSAVIDLWGNFPKDIQERLFERAVALEAHCGELRQRRIVCLSMVTQLAFEKM
jgi:hypothetical protein